MMKSKTFQNDPLHIKSFVLLLILAGIAAACNTLPGAQPSLSVPVKELPFPAADYDLINMVNHKLTGWVEAKYPGNQPLRNRWSYANDGDQELRQIVFAKDPACAMGMVYYVSEILPDGRLQLFKLCRIGDAESLSGMRTLTYLMAYDWQTGAMEQMAGPIPLGSSQVSWNPDLTRAVVYLDSKFSSQTLYWLRKDGFEPMDLVIEDEGQSWNLKNLFPDFPKDKIPLNGNAERAVWSPDGNSIALFASSEAIGKKDFDRFYVEYKLYIMNSDKLDPKPVLDNIHFPYITKWSPDSRYIAFIGQYGATKQDGVWLYSIENDSIVNIDTGKFQYVLWNPENESLFAIKCDNDQCSQILEYDLSEILKP